MDLRPKQQWSMEETNCLLALWSSAEIQKKLQGASRTKPLFEQIRCEMATAGYYRSLEQIINKLKKLKMEYYRDQKNDLERSGNGRPRRNPHFDVLDSVLGDRPAACQLTGALNKATAMLVEAMVDDTLLQNLTDPELSAIDDVDSEAEEPPPQECSLATPSGSSTSRAPSSSPLSQQVSQGKRKRADNAEMLLQYLERADERFLQHSKDMNDALLQKMETDTSALLGLMGRVVSVMEVHAPQPLYISIHRVDVLEEMVTAFKNAAMSSANLKLSFVDEKGAHGDGVSRDVYSTFWKCFFDCAAEGEGNSVPSLRPNWQGEEWKAIGRILAKGLKDHNYFPTHLAAVYTVALVFGEHSVTPEHLFESFLLYVSQSERGILTRALERDLDATEQEELLDFLDRMGVTTVPRRETLKQVISQISHKLLIQKPKYALDYMSNVARDTLQTIFSSPREIENMYNKNVHKRP